MSSYDYTLSEIDEKINNLMDLRFNVLKNKMNANQYSEPVFEILEKAEEGFINFSEKKKIACQGVNGAFSSIACDILFPDTDEVIFHKSFDNVFKEVENGNVDAGIIPIENSTSGSVAEVYNLMRKYHFYISGAVTVSVRHCLLTNGNVDIKNITDIYSHEQALLQCSNFLDKNPHIKIHSYPNTALAARMVSESRDSNIAAIASEKCASLYNMCLLKKDIQNTNTNCTVFICITKKLYIDKKANRISICLTLPHKPGSLSELLNRFSAAKLNLLKIESRPLPDRDFEFLFYFDFLGSVRDKTTLNLLSYLDSTLEHFEFLGNYYCE